MQTSNDTSGPGQLHILALNKTRQDMIIKRDIWYGVSSCSVPLKFLSLQKSSSPCIASVPTSSYLHPKPILPLPLLSYPPPYFELPFNLFILLIYWSIILVSVQGFILFRSRRIIWNLLGSVQRGVWQVKVRAPVLLWCLTALCSSVMFVWFCNMFNKRETTYFCFSEFEINKIGHF